MFGRKKHIEEIQFYKNLEELPIYNWHNLPEYGDYNLLVSNGAKLYSEERHKEFEDKYLELTQEYIDRYGVQQDTDMLFSYLKRKVNLQCELILTGRKAIKNEIKILEVEILALTPKETKEGSSLHSSLAGLSKFIGFKIDGKKTSVVEYKSYFQLLEDHNKQISKGNHGG